MALSFSTRNAISNVTVDFVSSGHSSGAGTLTAASSTTLTWQAPDSSTAGAAVTIANGETKILADGETTTLFIVVRRTSATALTGAASVIITASVSTSERLAEVDAAITRCLQAQSTTFGGDSVQTAQLDALRRYRAELVAQLGEEEGTRGCVAQVDLDLS